MGPLRDLDDPAFLRWPNLQMVLAVGLAAGSANGLWDALTHGWAGVNVPWMVGTALWVPLALVGLHLVLRRRAGRRTR
ncbi:hypothetical protein HC251_10125 [Iamia sp. SCSIO 61187]|uniref:hypothetical protein n=1 Tax=Iamia sp. SCSIO 61187 TaxID=2722752 RepID=UPI001C6357F0|nr:hypothetical protein [Iamia sp. SCSIO 61187]QYG92749.1 hypothetical protein HC251_10125 [Iamia sp. SCSIO 61187]